MIDDEMIFYMLKLNNVNSNGQYELINGLRIMTTLDGNHKPFSGRVVFLREDPPFYNREDIYQAIKLFDDLEGDSENARQLTLFKQLRNGAIYNLLVGFENNIVKTFGLGREKVGYQHNINYADNFFYLAKFHAKNKTDGTFEEAIINLYYSLLHGKENLKRLIEVDQDFEVFREDPFVKKTVTFKGPLIEFNELEIEKIKLNQSTVL